MSKLYTRLKIDMLLADHFPAVGAGCRVTTCLENLEMSENLTAVREMSGILLKIRELSGKNLIREKLPKLFIVNCIFVSIQIFSSSQLCLKC